MFNRGVFLDRDGTINEEVNYLKNLNQLKFIDGTIEAIKLLNKADYKVIIVTNQSAVARGYLTESTLQQIHKEIKYLLQSQNAHIDAFYYCPHNPTEGIGAYKIECDCRKPKPGILLRAVEDLKLDLHRSFVVADKISDLEAGYKVGCRNVLVLTGYGLESSQDLKNHAFQPNFIASNALHALQWIFKENNL